MKGLDVLIADYPDMLTKYKNDLQKESEEIFDTFRKFHQDKITRDHRDSQIEKILESND